MRPAPPLVRCGRAAGFTLLELLLVVALIAVAAGMVSLALRDGAAQTLDEEAARLTALLEGARARSRAMGHELRWEPLPDGGFRFTGLPDTIRLPARWLDERTRAEVVGARALVLGPEPLIDAQQVILRLGERQLVLATDGLKPFAPVDAAGAGRQP